MISYEIVILTVIIIVMEIYIVYFLYSTSGIAHQIYLYARLNDGKGQEEEKFYRVTSSEFMHTHGAQPTDSCSTVDI